MRDEERVKGVLEMRWKEGVEVEEGLVGGADGGEPSELSCDSMDMTEGGRRVSEREGSQRSSAQSRREPNSRINWEYLTVHGK